MKMSKLVMGIIAMQLFAGLGANPAWAADQTMTGKVSDAMCGAKHQMAGNDASCTRTCVKGGSKYALVVRDKVYTLEATDKAVLDKLDELAGTSARVTGEVKGDTIVVKSAAAGS